MRCMHIGLNFPLQQSARCSHTPGKHTFEQPGSRKVVMRPVWHSHTRADVVPAQGANALAASSGGVSRLQLGGVIKAAYTHLSCPSTRLRCCITHAQLSSSGGGYSGSSPPRGSGGGDGGGGDERSGGPEGRPWWQRLGLVLRVLAAAAAAWLGLLVAAATAFDVWQDSRIPKLKGSDSWRVSIIIPTLNEEKAIVGCIQAVREATAGEAGVEVIVADGGSTDRTVALARTVADKVLTGLPRGRAPQMNAGAQAASGDVLMFLHADTHISTGLLTTVRKLLASPRNVVLGMRPVIQGSHGQQPLHLLSAHNLVKTYYCPLLLEPFNYVRGMRVVFGDQVICCRTPDFKAIGGYDTRLPIMEDGDLCVRLHHRGPSPACSLGYKGPGRIYQVLGHTAVTSGRRLERWGSLWGTYVHFRIGLGWYLGATPAELKQLYNDLYTDDFR